MLRLSLCSRRACLAGLLLALACLSPPAAAQRAPSRAVGSSTAHCAAADTFLRESRELLTVVEPDTIDDWRTRQRLVGCRITAAGGTTRGVQAEAVAFYERVRAAGWTRTPEPRDAPNEASLRFRRDSSDCLFNVYGPAMLLTDAEGRVDEQRALRAGEVRYHVYVMCLPALPAAPRGLTRTFARETARASTRERSPAVISAPAAPPAPAPAR
jgi:hypothetical protein